MIFFFHNLAGYYLCKKCCVYQLNILGHRKSYTFTFTVTSRSYTIKQFITRASKDFVYLIQCPCGKQYVDRTTRSFSARVNEHINIIKTGMKGHSFLLDDTIGTIVVPYLWPSIDMWHPERGDRICQKRGLSTWDQKDSQTLVFFSVWHECGIGCQCIHQ